MVGDLFDRNSVSEITVARLFKILSDEKEVILMRGNHDENSERYGEICSLQLLGAILPNSYTIFKNPETIGNYHFIPHCFNQDEFDKWVQACPSNKTVFIHANYNNKFAVEADHSLNLSIEAIAGLEEKGCKVILGHEHAARQKGIVTILGCFYPTSISDCLSGHKR